MRKLLITALLAGGLFVAAPLLAQQVCPGYSIVINTPEDELTLAYNGAENPQEQIAALDKFVQEHPDSKFMPCAHEYYTMAYVKLGEYDKVIELGEKGLTEHEDLMLIMNVTKAYVASGKLRDAAFEAVFKAPEQIKAESTPSRPTTVSEEEWKKTVDEAVGQAKEWDAYMEYAFFQLLQREPDAGKRVQWLDRFVQAYPESPNAGKTNLQYFLAYQALNDAAKATEYGEKGVAADPTSLEILNALADYYATTLQTNLEKAEEYAKKVIDLAPAAKPEGMSEDQLKVYRDNHLGLAHATLGYIAFLRGSKTHKVAPAIQEFKTAVDLLGGNPMYQGRTLFYLGWAYEVHTPANHKLAAEALTRAAAISSPWQGQATELLGKVRKAMGE
jgi:tetratricopeptide (TPR) repeat protein